MPSPLPRQVRWSLSARLSPSSAAFPVKQSGRLLQLLFRGLLSVYSCYGLHARGVAKRPFPSKAPTASLPPLPFRLLPGRANPFPGGRCTRCSPAPFHGALFQQLGPVHFGRLSKNCFVLRRSSLLGVGTLLAISSGLFLTHSSKE